MVIFLLFYLYTVYNFGKKKGLHYMLEAFKKLTEYFLYSFLHHEQFTVKALIHVYTTDPTYE